MTINYDDLDEMYDGLPSRERMVSAAKPVGSLTDNARKVTPNRNGAHKRVREFGND
jgi:hypothetical protein